LFASKKGKEQQGQDNSQENRFHKNVF
jgi:hypothetical protein